LRGQRRRKESAEIQYCKEKPEHWGKSVEAICAAILVCITAYYAYYARQQWVESQKTANAAICSTQIAAKSLKLSQDAFEASQVAVLQPKLSLRNAGKGLFLQIDIFNSGNIAATRVNGEIVVPHHAPLRLANVTVTNHSASPEYPSGFITRTVDLNIPPNNPQALASEHLKVKIRLTYWNGLDQVTSSFCYGLTVSPVNGSQDWQDCENQDAFQQTMR
jgi:hypothetical protein